MRKEDSGVCSVVTKAFSFNDICHMPIDRKPPIVRTCDLEVEDCILYNFVSPTDICLNGRRERGERGVGIVVQKHPYTYTVERMVTTSFRPLTSITRNEVISGQVQYVKLRGPVYTYGRSYEDLDIDNPALDIGILMKNGGGSKIRVMWGSLA